MAHKEALQQYIAATNTHDFNNVKQFLHSDALYWFTDRTCTTLMEIQNYFENAWETIKEEVYSATNIQWVSVDYNSATCTYTYNYEGYYNDQFVSGSGRATNIFVKDENEQWKLIHEHLSNL